LAGGLIPIRRIGFDLNEYARVIIEETPREVAYWLFANAPKMTEDMFLNVANDWGGLDPEHLLVLRACAPDGVFTQTAREGYLTSIGDDQELRALAPALFGTDLEVITRIPSAHQETKSHLIKLVQLAYKHDIRLADRRLDSYA
jgi:hypothetical protein